MTPSHDPGPAFPPVRIAIIGYGLAGSTFHAPFIATTPGAEVAAVVARSSESAAQVRAQHPRARVVDSVRALEPLDIDAAVVATPNATHADLAAELLSMGIVAVVDKPLAVTAAEAEALIAESDSLGVGLTCYQNRRWDGDYLTVKSLSPDLGAIHRLESRFERWRPEVKPGWKEEPGPGTGILFDLGPHLVDQALHLLGPAVNVHSEVGIIREGARVPDDAFIAITHESGAISHLWTSAVAGAPGPRFRVQGANGAYLKRGMDPQEEALRAGGVPATPDWGRETPEHWGRLYTGDRSRLIETVPGDYGGFYADLVAAVRQDAPLPVDPRDSAIAIRLIEEVSVASG